MFKQMLTKTLVRCVIGIIGIFQYASAQVPDTFTRITEGDVVNDTSDSYGVAWGDYDNDGDLDLYVATYMGPNRLYRNDGNEIFSEVAVQLGVNGGNGWSLGVSWADYDNDGDLDLFVGEAQNKLFRNDGNSFSDVGISSGFTHLNATYSAVWADYDNDGDLDLFTANWYGVNLLYQNDQNYFTDVAPSVGIVETGYSRAAAWGDYDNDGDLDLYVCRGASWENQPDLLYRNDNAYFTNVADSVGITDVLYSEGVDWGDYDNDGDLDLFVTTSNLQPNKLYR
ncbi:VCBS repeat-containing protein, partial [candidate division KSB1 bacterium]|nr:VCBS repeat-containing protein [candidate division KSB1 bacterium]